MHNLEEKIGYAFANPRLLHEALTHRSYASDNPSWPYANNERLEFLGDAVLELAVTKYLFETLPNEEEGKMTLIRASLVNAKMLARIAGEIELGRHLSVARNRTNENERAQETMLADAFEALIGALYLDRGFEAAYAFVEETVLVRAEETIRDELYKNAKSTLQEMVQETRKMTPTYRVLEEIGPDHEKTFRVGAYLDGVLKAEGVGASKQEAELDAAAGVIRQLEGEEKR